MDVLVSYDITHNKIRRRVFKLLKSYGLSIQYSVFLIEASEHQLRILQRDLAQILKNKNTISSDTIVLMPLCPVCTNRMIQLGSTFSKLDCRQVKVV